MLILNFYRNKMGRTKHSYAEKNQSNVYTCTEHEQCGRRIRIRPWLLPSGGVEHDITAHVEEKFMIFTSGNHGDKVCAEKVEGTVHGIHPRFVKVVDDLLASGLTPSKIIQFLVKDAMDKPCAAGDEASSALTYIPTALQITTVRYRSYNEKKYQK